MKSRMDVIIVTLLCVCLIICSFMKICGLEYINTKVKMMMMIIMIIMVMMIVKFPRSDRHPKLPDLVLYFVYQGNVFLFDYIFYRHDKKKKAKSYMER